MIIDPSGVNYGEAWPNGPYIHSGNLPAGCGDLPLLHCRVSQDGRVVGKGQAIGNAWYWDGAMWRDLGPSAGNSIGAFHPIDGTVYVSTAAGVAIFSRAGLFLALRHGGYAGSQGLRNILADGTVVTGDATYGVYLGLNEYTDFGNGIVIGQGNADGGICVSVDGGAPRMILPGAQYFVRANLVGSDVAIYSTSFPQGTRVLTTLAELRALPLAAAPTPVPVPAPTLGIPMHPAAVVVDTFRLSAANQIADGDVIVAHDPNNAIGTRVRAWVSNGSMFLSIDYPGAGPNLAGQTGAKRMVR